jgi:DNA-directed RNA polymerase specialized sigma24 family protein
MSHSEAWGRAQAVYGETQDREVVEDHILRHLKGLSLAEIAGELSCTKAAVVGLLHRGVQKLRALLEEESQE